MLTCMSFSSVKTAGPKHPWTTLKVKKTKKNKLNIYIYIYIFQESLTGSHLWKRTKYPPFFFIFCNFERLCLYNRDIIFAALIRKNCKTNMTKNRDKIVIFKKEKRNCDMIFLPYRPLLQSRWASFIKHIRWSNSKETICGYFMWISQTNPDVLEAFVS